MKSAFAGNQESVSYWAFLFQHIKVRNKRVSPWVFETALEKVFVPHSIPRGDKEKLYLALIMIVRNIFDNETTLTSET